MTHRSRATISAAIFALMLATPAQGVAPSGELVSARLESRSFAESRIGIASTRAVQVYLPRGYATSGRRYPVIYYLNHFFEDHTAPFANHDAAALFDEAIADGVIGEMIVVTADFGTPAGGSWYVNSAATGNWEDFLVAELVPHIDRTYRTLARGESRGVAGDRMGGYGAIRFGMRHPEIFGAVYGLHPIGVGPGVTPMFERPNWQLLAGAQSLEDLGADGFSQIFTSIFQAHLPAPDRPPLYFEMPARRIGERLEIAAPVADRLQQNFFLVLQIGRYADNLKRLRALKFDWGRNDPNPDHVISLEAFTRALDEYAVPYEAEAFHGGFGDRNWGKDGRVYTDVLPFFAEHLVFEGE